MVERDRSGRPYDAGVTSVLVIDAANVVGSVPDGWWLDRAGASARLLAGLTTTALPYDAVVVVLEGRARSGVPAGTSGARTGEDGEVPEITVVHAPGSGDDEIVVQCRAFAGVGADVSLASADRGLLARVAPYGVTLVGPRTVRLMSR